MATSIPPGAPSPREVSQSPASIEIAGDTSVADALKPDPSREADFKVDDNRFAFSPGQLNKLLNPKSLAAFHALGGLRGLEKGLRTDIRHGLNLDEIFLSGAVSFGKAIGSDNGVDTSIHSNNTNSNSPFSDRKRVYGVNILPQMSVHFWKSIRLAFSTWVRALFPTFALILIAQWLYQVKTNWLGLAIVTAAILIHTFTKALYVFREEITFRKMNQRMHERDIKVIRSGKSWWISIDDILVGDVVHLEPGDIVPADGIFIGGHGVKCDESSCTGESDPVRKYPAHLVSEAINNQADLRKMDPFIISGAKVLEGVATFWSLLLVSAQCWDRF
ncbi:E1-E2 ATPase-domain-containing protein [Aspergillus cavernicola]|uniref:E1-E2 ATPase-domain-containing protein n=1 Tax=Aspergillus cavernicola TaxID=176166 RepID=A0ABR4HC32_9EURO